MARSPMARNTDNRDTALDAASGLALLLSVIAFFFSSYAVIQAMNARRATQPTNGLPPGGSSAPGGGGAPAGVIAPQNRPALPFLSAPDRVEPGQFVQPAYRGGGRVEILSAYRVNNSGQSNLVNVRLRVERLRDRIDSNGDIDLAEATAINTRTNMTYPVTAVRTRGNEAISLYTLQPGRSTEATITMRVPEGLQRVDISIPETDVFRNVPISIAQG